MKRITVTTNDPENRRVTLSATGKVLVPFVSAPRYVNFQQLDPFAAPPSQKVTIRQGDGGPLNLKIVNTGANNVEADLVEIEPGKLYELWIGLQPPQKSGRLRTWVTLTTGVGEVPRTTVPVYANVPATWSNLE